jgi:Tfp pilus assembly protein PilN
VNRTNDLYLLSVNPEGGRVLIRGQSNSVESIANFIAALKGSGVFEDVQLRQYFQDDQYNRVGYKFIIDCNYKSPAAAAPTAQPATPSAAPTRRAGM